MKKSRNIIIALLIFEIVFVGLCILIYHSFTKTTEPVEQKKPETEVKEAIFELSSYPKVDASINMQSLANAFILKFTGDKVDTSKLGYTNADTVYKRLVDGEVDLIISKAPTQEELSYASSKGIELECLPLVTDAFVFYVNNNNPVRNLSLEEIKKIYSGSIIKWSEVGGDDSDIKAFQRNENSENQLGMKELVMNKTELASPLKDEKSKTEDIENNIISDYDNGINSLGYSYYSYAKKVYDEIDSDTLDGIRLLRVDNVKPSYENIQNDTYPLKKIYYVITRKNKSADGVVAKLRDAMLSNNGKMIAKEAGYVPTK